MDDTLTCMFLHSSICVSLCIHLHREYPSMFMSNRSADFPQTHTHTHTRTHAHTHTCLSCVVLAGWGRKKAKRSRVNRGIQTSSTDCLLDTHSSLLSPLFFSLLLSLSLSLPSYSLLHFTLPLCSASQSALNLSQTDFMPLPPSLSISHT